jgi:transcription-repair coupling factor (superfamily II helicase)
MYAQLLEEAVAELRGEPPATLPPVRLEIPVTAYVPPEYIAYEATKIDAHRRIAQAGDPRALDEVRAELTDRFGVPPEPVENLLALQSVRLKAAALRAAAVAYRAGRLQVDGLDLDDQWAARLRASGDAYAYFKQKRLLSAHRRDDDGALLAWVGSVLDAIIEARTS